MKHKHLLRIIGSIFLLVLGFYSGFRYQEIKDQTEKTLLLAQKDQLITNYQNQLKVKDEENNLIMEDRGKPVKNSESKYEFRDFGIYSPLFEGKTIFSDYIWYRGKYVIDKRIDLTDKNYPWTDIMAEVWEFEGDQTIFGGDENYEYHAIRLDDIKSKWKEKYVNRQNLLMYWSYGYGPKVIEAVFLDFYQNFSPSGNPILFRIRKIGLNAISENDPSVLKAKEEIKKIADTVNFRQ